MKPVNLLSNSRRTFFKLGLLAIVLFSASPAYSIYIWQVTKVTGISGGGQTVCKTSLADPLVLALEQCPGGISKPHTATSYTISWFVNSTNSNSGGTMVDSFTRYTQPIYNPSENWIPPTDSVGTFYYYAELSNPSVSSCGFTGVLVSDAQEIKVIATANTIDVQEACYSFTWIDGINYTESNNTAQFTYSGVLANGCDSIVTLNLTIDSVSDKAVTVSGQTLTASLANASYRWFNCDDNYSLIPNETGQSYQATANGNYAVEITQNNCVDTSECMSITGVSINNELLSSMIKIFPNPTNGILHIQFSQVPSNVELNVIDLTGKLFLQKSIMNAKDIQLEIDAPAGIYFLQIIDEKGSIAIQKFIKD